MGRRNEMRGLLGISYGTARARLNKQIMFFLAQKTGLDICFRCSKKIESPTELSVDHKTPWFRKSVSLFWDLDNIAFSHNVCNSLEGSSRVPKGSAKHLRALPRNRRAKDAPIGNAWCAGHMDYRPIVEFHSNTRNPHGVASYCKECRKVRLD